MIENKQQPELRPCPFCGGSATMHSTLLKDGDHIIVCNKCGAASGYFPNREEAVRAWDRRVSDEHMA